MIVTPFDTRRYVFVDWDNSLLGVMVLPKVIQDVRAFTCFFVAQNMICHAPKGMDPEGVNDLRQSYRSDPWEEERLRLRREAERTYPFNEVYPEESWYFAAGDDGLELRHSLRFLPGRRVKEYERGRRRDRRHLG